MKNTAICYLTNNKNTEEMERRYSLLPSTTDNFILTEKKNNLIFKNANVFIFDSEEEFIKTHFIRWTYVSLVRFYEKNPNYEYYWLLEDDVIFNGNFADFFNETFNLDEDFIITNGHYREQNNSYWYSCEHNKIHGDYETNLPLAGGFTGIQRWSNKLASILLDLHKKNIYGHLESYPATVAYINKLKIGFLNNILKKHFIESYCNWNCRFNINDLEKLPKDILLHAVKF